jgi:hypothetical protein
MTYERWLEKNGWFAKYGRGWPSDEAIAERNRLISELYAQPFVKIGHTFIFHSKQEILDGIRRLARIIFGLEPLDDMSDDELLDCLSCSSEMKLLTEHGLFEFHK